MSDSVGKSIDLLRERRIVGALDAAFVLGTGLGDLGAGLQNEVAIPYADLPAFPRPGVSGHAGRIVFGTRHGRRVAFLQGRAHYYEDGDPRVMEGALETLAQLGCGAVVLTAACGSLRPDLAPASLMLVCDHINFNGLNPLIGMKGDDRFVSLIDAYDPGLRGMFREAAGALGQALPEGVYMWFSGPSFETPAEIRMAQILGADAVGMSVVPEVILARRLGLRVAAISMITNHAAGFHGGAPTHAQTRAIAAEGARSLSALIDAFLQELSRA